MRPHRTELLGVAAILLFLAAPLQARAQSPGNGPPLSLGVAVSGLVGKILVADGAHVTAGQTILEIDCRPLEADVKVRAANAAAAKAAYERAKNGSRPDEITIGEANVGVAQARSEEATDAYARLKALTEGVSVTRAQLLEGRREARVTAAQLDDAKKRLALLVAGSRQEDIAEALAAMTPPRRCWRRAKRDSINARSRRRSPASCRLSRTSVSSSAPRFPRRWRGWRRKRRRNEVRVMRRHREQREAIQTEAT